MISYGQDAPRRAEQVNGHGASAMYIGLAGPNAARYHKSVDQEDGSCNDTWPKRRTDSVDGLQRHIVDIEKSKGADERLAWRGHARTDWMLASTLDRRLQEAAPSESYEAWLAREQAVLARLKCLASPYASQTERLQLEGDVWTALALGRHAGLPTRLLDWTWSLWVAVWFACHEHSDADGVVWWFNQKQLEDAIDPLWEGWGVPDRATYRGFSGMPTAWKVSLGLHQRALEATAFSASGKAWVTKIHYGFPCPRMEAQQGFMTACGRLRTTHNDAIDDLRGSERITRGRVVIAASIKGEVLDLLRTMNIHAKSLEYPGIDIVARMIRP